MSELEKPSWAELGALNEKLLDISTRLRQIQEAAPSIVLGDIIVDLEDAAGWTHPLEK